MSGDGIRLQDSVNCHVSPCNREMDFHCLPLTDAVHAHIAGQEKSIFHSSRCVKKKIKFVLSVLFISKKMCSKFNILFLMAFMSCALANYNGPFVLWGRDELKKVDVSALEGLDDEILRNIYSESPAIVLFVRNASNRLTEENFPTFKDLLQKNKYVYLTQHWLPSDPIDYNVNAEVRKFPKKVGRRLSARLSIFVDWTFSRVTHRTITPPCRQEFQFRIRICTCR